MTDSVNPFSNFSDADLKAVFRRALITVAVLGIILAIVLTVMYGWQTGALLLAGAVISATGVLEWQRLVVFINARLDKAQAPGGAGRVVASFLLRLLMAGAILFFSLKYLHGSVYALVGGLVLAIVALTGEAVRLIRS